MRDALAFTALVAAGSLLACSSSSAPGGPDAAVDGAGPPDAAEDRARVDASEDAADDVPQLPYEAAPPPPLGGVRVANLSADAPPIDFCLAPHDTAKWQGPMLAAAVAREDGGGNDEITPGLIVGDGGATGLGYPGVTSYFYVAPGQYDARLVAAGSTDCSVPVVSPDAKALPALTKGAVVTIAMFGQFGQAAGDAGAAALKVVGFDDDLDVPPPTLVGTGRIAARFINAAPSVPSVDFGTGPVGVFMGGYVTMFDGVLYGQASKPEETTAMAPYVDANGYRCVSALLQGSFSASVLQNESPTPLVMAPTSVGEGALLTVILLPGGAPSSASGAGTGDAGLVSEGGLQLLQCVDNAGSVGAGGNCSVL